MKIFDILIEGRDAVLYHTMDQYKARNVFSDDIMPARFEHNIPGYGKIKGNSFTRNVKLIWNGCIRLTIDQNKLSRRYKIIPLDGEHAFRFSMNSEEKEYWERIKDKMRDRLLHRGSPNNTEELTYGIEPLSEEFVIGDIKNLHQYIIRIYFYANEGFNSIGPGAKVTLYDIVNRYCERWKISLVVNPAIPREISRIKQEWEDEDEENY